MVTQSVAKDMPILEMVDKYPEIVPVLMGYGLHCVGCSFSKFDTLENGAKIHGIDGEEFEMMLRDVNTVIAEKNKK